MVNYKTSQVASCNSDDLQSVTFDEKLIPPPQTYWDTFDCFKLIFCCGICCMDED